MIMIELTVMICHRRTPGLERTAMSGSDRSG